jgi:hypothetical protein
MATPELKQPSKEELLKHTVYYDSSTSELKDDVSALAACWVSMGLSWHDELYSHVRQRVNQLNILSLTVAVPCLSFSLGTKHRLEIRSWPAHEGMCSKLHVIECARVTAKLS